MSASPPPGWDLPDPPFHAGELAVQERIGSRARMAVSARRAIRRYMPEQHRAFYAQLPYVFIGSVDATGQPWASMLFGAPGFLSTPDATLLRVRARPLWGDPLAATLREGAEVAALGVELPTRRRNRAFGVAEAVGPDGFDLRVRQTLGVCPQYIQGRTLAFTSDPGQPEARPVHRAGRLDAAARAIIAAADTYFVASANPRAADGVARGTDISHRGGRPGFVRIDDDQTLTAPDFIGNFLFNTLGNFELEPRAGLLFVDFAGGDMLYVAARAEVIWQGPEVAAFTGAERLVRYRVTEAIRVAGSLPARFSAPDRSPLLARTGSWEDAARTLAAAAQPTAWRPIRIAAVRDESATIRSFTLEAADGGGLPLHVPGQHLPIRLPAAAGGLLRSYTLSDAPNGRDWRISVKREGRGGASDWLHDHAGPGTTLEALAPRGEFIFDVAAPRPAVLISAGVGITPMIAMLAGLLVNDGRTRFPERLIFLHAARNGREFAFGPHLRALAARHANLSLHIRFSQPDPADAAGQAHDSTGRIDAGLLRRLLPAEACDCYLCGPAPFMQAVHDLLRALGVPEARVHAESFGAAVLRRDAPADLAGPGVPVAFARTGVTALWRSGTLLELAEQAGVPAPFSCRSGVCGTCATGLAAGGVTYAEAPAQPPAAGEVLICCARPNPGGVTLDL